MVTIPGSKNKGRIIENLDVSLVELTDEEFHSLEEQAVIVARKGRVKSTR